ncbi:hypothetical protein [Sporolituus thermophilus]|uniref:Uncharacterized protein n=1 Tax=Sporolituus thermophilus DSM 23256 TaxID=1123285 RepID=A0A1G7I6Z7_9FIRM|nr:hypothetical protein [Sporolituus thermophilus]SDF08432.1 hypothetical protein SAMN05660235_00375 [Sporolituus thermophilus DSM 23256]
MAKNDRSMVHHLTRITLKLLDDPIPFDLVRKAQPPSAKDVRAFGRQLGNRAERVAKMMELLAAKGFTFTAGKDCIYADSAEMEAQAVKRYLLENGFQDQEFQVYLEYVRKWGIM